MSFGIPTNPLELYAKQMRVAKELVLMDMEVGNTGERGYLIACHHPDGMAHLIDGLIFGAEGQMIGEIEVTGDDN